MLRNWSHALCGFFVLFGKSPFLSHFLTILIIILKNYINYENSNLFVIEYIDTLTIKFHIMYIFALKTVNFMLLRCTVEYTSNLIIIEDVIYG